MLLLAPHAERRERQGPTKDGVTFEGFAQWWSRYQSSKRRAFRRLVREMFMKADTDSSGILDREEFVSLVIQIEESKSLPNLYDISAIASSATASRKLAELAWSEVKKVPLASENRDKRAQAELMLQQGRKSCTVLSEKVAGTGMGVDFGSFESWWREKTGLKDPDVSASLQA